MQLVQTRGSVDRVLARDNRPDEGVLDDVYRKYQDSHPFMAITHFVDHSTMGSEALVALGLGHKVRAWISRHRVRPYEAPATGIALPSAWKDAVGQEKCHGDWLRHFESELNDKSIDEVLALWVERFARDSGALLFHGLIRTAHAARALQHKDSGARRRELARGLALWAIGLRSASPAEMTQREENADPTGEIMHCARAGAATFVRKSTIPNLHLVTGPMAFMMLAHRLEPRVHVIAAAAFRQTHAKAIEALARDEREVLSEPAPFFARTGLEALAEKTDAHPAKLTEAALRAYQATGDTLFLKAAGQVRDYSLWRAFVG